MSMFSSGVNRALADARRADQAAATLGQQLTTGRKIQVPEDDPSSWLEASRVDSTSTYLDAVHTGLDEVATNLGVVDTAMQAIGEYLGTMQSQLQQALTLPAGDPSRQQFITNFNNVRQQIDDTVNTTAETGALNLMSDPAANPQAGNLQVLVGANGETRTVHAEEVDTGVNGLNIPSLDPATATDGDLQSALANLTTAQSTLAARQMVLGADTASIKNYQGETSQASSLYQNQVDSLTGDDANETTLELQSVQLRHSLAVQTLASIGNDRSAVRDCCTDARCSVHERDKDRFRQMPLKITLKPRERLILGGAVIRNGDVAAHLLVENEVPILRERDILSERNANSPCRRIYFAIQLMYVDQPNLAAHHDLYRMLVEDVQAAAPSTAKLTGEISKLVMQKNYYQALKIARRLIHYEQELLERT